uniref:Uncharacterized protein n=1 Tax=Cacopsylla melanoneura TaxID=428564 RepID=A0A8D9EEV5_9HEMI
MLYCGLSLLYHALTCWLWFYYGLSLLYHALTCWLLDLLVSQRPRCLGHPSARPGVPTQEPFSSGHPQPLRQRDIALLVYFQRTQIYFGVQIRRIVSLWRRGHAAQLSQIFRSQLNDR